MTKDDRSWNERNKYLSAIEAVYTASFSFFIMLALFFVALTRQGDTSNSLQAATCSLPTSITTTIELTPDGVDNIIDCASQDITVTSTGKLIFSSYSVADTSITNDVGVVLKVGNLTIETGGEIVADGKGYTPNSTDGGSAVASTGISGGSGGGHGGAGGSGNTIGGSGNTVGMTGASIGNKDYPTTLGGAGSTSGSNGTGGNGGGAIKIESTGTVTINGRISADGDNGVLSGDEQTAGGGGAGGSIWVVAQILAGSGQVSAKGGGTDTTASYYGGGGGGGRVALICTSSTSFPAGNVTVAAGTGSQSGQIGSLVGPGCKPSEPTILKFYEKNATAGKVDRELFVSELTSKTALTFASNLNGSNLKLEVELRQRGQSFTNTPTNAQVTALSNKTCTGIPVTNGVTINSYCGYVEVTTGLVASTEYKWQARIVSTSGIASNWVQFGSNTVSEVDFTIVGAATSLVAVEGNNQSAVVGQLVPIKPKAKVVDAAGYGVPFYSLTSWSVLTGGGTLSNSVITTDKWGEVTTDWTVGTTAGVNNNTMRIYRSSPALTLTYTASALPGVIASYGVTAETSLSIINSPFSYTVSAKDMYGNVVPFTENLSIVPVSSHSTSTPGLGTLTPDTVLFAGTPPNSTTVYRDPASGTITISDASYSYSESIAVKVYDASGRVGFSNSILFVSATGSCPSVTIDTNQTWNAVDVPSGIFDCRGYGPFTVRSGYTLTLNSYNNGDSNYTNDFGVTLLVDSLSVESTGVVTATGLGYPAYVGPSGDSHGGYSANGQGTPYGNVYEPSAFGSGGNYSFYGAAAPGGGAIKIASTGNASINGTISANGLAGSGNRYDGGAGGSIWLDVAEISGSGTLQVNGGYGAGSPGGGGSGGRLAVYYTTNTTFGLDGTKLQAYGAASSNYGYSGAGTVYIEQKGVDTTHAGTLLVDNNNHNSSYTAGVPAGDYVFDSIQVKRYGDVEFMGTTSKLTINSASGLSGDATKPLIKVTGTLEYTGVGRLTIEGVDLGINGKVTGIQDVTVGGSVAAGVTLYANTWFYNNTNGHSFGDVVITDNGTMTMVTYQNGTTSAADDYGVNLSVTGLTLQAGGTITSDGYGYPEWSAIAGDTHGGYAINSTGIPYGSVYEPITLGSGGDYGYYGTPGKGGGAIKIAVSGNSILNGTITANGTTGSGNKYDGGAGGSIWLTTGGIEGTGVIRANGGNGAWDPGNGGSGGRIAVYYSTDNGFAITGTNLQTYGGSGANGYAGPGTVYLEQVGVNPVKGGTLIVDNNNHNGRTAGIISGNYKFTKIDVKRYGHVEFIGNDSVLEIASGQGMVGDSTKPSIKVSGTVNYTGTERLAIDGVDLTVNGRLSGVQDVTIGQTLSSGVTLYAKTWYHSNSNGYVFGDVIVTGNGTLTLKGNQNGTADVSDDYGVAMSMTGLTLNTGGKIIADGEGYPEWIAVAGDVHGGYARNSIGVPYGSVYEPVTLGSGGDYGYYGTPGKGGGAMKLVITGSSHIDGIITANGTTGSGNKYDGGAGGSIWIDTQEISGTGTVRANGGDGAWDPGNGGSGGRISMYYSVNNGFGLNGVNLQSYGGNGSTGYAGPGTVYVEQKGTNPVHGGTLIIDNNNHNGLTAGVTTGNYEFSKIQASRYGHVEFIGDEGTLELASGQGMVGDATKPLIKVSGTINYTGSGRLTIDGVDLGVNGRLMGVQDVTIGETLSSGVTLYANTWYHNNTNGYTLGDVVITSNGVLSVVGYQNGVTSYTDDYGVSISMTGLTVQSGGKILGDGLGYPKYVGVSSGIHGGYQTANGAMPYGDIYLPTTLGSGGIGAYYGDVGAGGSAIKLTISGTSTIDGTISMNGTDGSGIRGDGGAGGSILLDTVTIAGSGIMRTNGGLGVVHPGGSGGRIAVYYQNNDGFIFDSSHLQSYGAAGGSWYSGPGTVYVEHKGAVSAQKGDLLVDNNNHNGLFAGLSQATYDFRSITATRYGNVEITGQESVLKVSAGNILHGDSTKSQVKVSGTLEYTGSGALVVDGVDLGLNGKMVGVQDVLVGVDNNSALTLYAKTWYHNKDNPYVLNNVVVSGLGQIVMASSQDGDTVYTDDEGVYVQMASLNLATNGKITADGKGYTHDQGPSAGGAHGGYIQGSTTILPQGSIYEPISLGSGGSGGYYGTPGDGGGAMKILVTGEAVINGDISANGTTGSGIRYGSGAGGSIWLDAGTLSGSGTIKANSTTAVEASAGSGGRIAVYYNENNGFSFAESNIQAFGGNGAGGYGGPGSIYVENRTEQTTHAGDLFLRNNGNAGRTADFEAGVYKFNNFYVGQNVTMWVKANTEATIIDFSTQELEGLGVLLELTGNFTLSSGASILGIGSGFAPAQGPGKGEDGVGYSGGGGAGNGGNGGSGQSDGSNIPAAGGTKVGDQLQPLTLGSGGGNSGVGALGGNGGGSFGVMAKGILNEDGQYEGGVITISGTINMSGSEGKTGSPGGGGGAGGSILLHGNSCSIGGNILAEGGSGGNSDVDGGGGGGGHISILYNVGPCDIEGAISVAEGVPEDVLNYGAQVGQVGTFPPEPNSVPWPSQYREQFEVRDDIESTLPSEQRVAANSGPTVLGTTESAIPVGGIINGTTVTLKADAYDAGARPIAPKRLGIQVELKKITEQFDGHSNIFSSETVTFSGGEPVVLSVTASSLEMGASYKWRVRTVNTDSGLTSEWQEYGGNASGAADFTITTVASLELVLSKSSMDLTESASITVTAKNSLNNTDTSYRGTIVFSSTSGAVDLPASYTFTSGDAGSHTFTDELKFFESGNFSVMVEDMVNPSLVDSANITVTIPDVPFLTISASETELTLGDQTTLLWQSGFLSDLEINQGIGSVSAAGSLQITPPIGETTYTIQGRMEEGTLLTASVVITVSQPGSTPVVTSTLIVTTTPTATTSGTVTATPTTTPTKTVTPTKPPKTGVICPIIEAFSISNRIIKMGDPITISWQVKDAEKVSIDAFSGSLPKSGSASVVLKESLDITLYASNGKCKRTEVKHVEVVNAYPWEGAGGLLIGLLALETIGLQIGAAQGNLWFAFLGLIDRKKNRKPWGIVYNSVTKKLLPRVVVRLWDAVSGKLVDTVVTDANGIFKLTPRKGKYVVKVALAGYVFPSKLVSGDSDSGYSNIYKGEVIEVNESTDMLMIAIPVDPTRKQSQKSSIGGILNLLEEFVSILSPIVLTVGFAYSVVVTIMFPLTLNYIIVAVYGITFIIKALVYLSTPRLFGSVTGIDGKTVSGLELGLFDKEFNNLVSRTFTSKQGNYNFVVKNQEYYLRIMDPAYKLLSKHAAKDGLLIPKTLGSSGVKLVAERLIVYPVQKLVNEK